MEIVSSWSSSGKRPQGGRPAQPGREDFLGPAWPRPVSGEPESGGAGSALGGDITAP